MPDGMSPLRSVALVGNPNCGKTALFNLLTGARQKVANYAGVTVERKIGRVRLPDGHSVSVIDLPGTYSLQPATPDEQVTLEVIEGRRTGEGVPELLVAVVDATNLRMNLRLVLELKRLGRPMLVALNMVDLARKRGLLIDSTRLAAELGCPVVETVAVRSNGQAALLDQLARWRLPAATSTASSALQGADGHPAPPSPAALQAEVRRILAIVSPLAPTHDRLQLKLDAWVLHPVWGLLILATLLFVTFQAVFSWANLPMDLIRAAMAALGEWVTGQMGPGPLRSLLVDGVIAGAGSVLVFLPQIMILFLFILTLEDSGYLPRAAFLLDRLMGSVGLSGRAFIPLLSSFACAIPGIMATRTIQNQRDRLATIMVAPLMTCSARLPVYALIIGAFIPKRSVGIFNFQGLVLFGLYLAGIVSAMAVAYVLKRTIGKGHYQPLMLELPNYHWPNLRNLAIGLWERIRIFITRVGTIILALMILLWFLSSFPAPPDGALGPAIQYSLAGRLGQLLQVVFAPIGFNWQIAIALIPGLAAREVAVGALGTVYALSATGDQLATTLTPMIAATWSLPTALSLLAWYVFAPQCISTLSIVKRETNSWKPALAMAAYMFALAYLASFATYQISRLLLGGAA